MTRDLFFATGKQDRFTTCFKTWGTGSLFCGVGRGCKLQSPFGAKALQTDKHIRLAAALDAQNLAQVNFVNKNSLRK